MSEKAFIVRHYADDVVYDCNGFVEKNRDSINEEHLLLLKASEVGQYYDNWNIVIENATYFSETPHNNTVGDAENFGGGFILEHLFSKIW